MASKLAVYDTGYEDQRFEHIVSQSFHCIICTSVLKDAVMCSENEHLFCRACITRHLMNFQTCPTCMEPLTVDTLSQAPRGIRNLLAELKIRCEFFDRGCGKFIELGDLERHVTECGFAPAVCSNEGCQLEVNKQDLLHHETSVCELRRVQCHSCNEIRQETDTVKVNLAEINEKLDRNEEKLTKVELLQEQLNKQEESNRRLETDNIEIKKSLNEITKLLQTLTQQTSHEVEAEQMKKGIIEADGMNREPMIVIAKREDEGRNLNNSLETFSQSTDDENIESQDDLDVDQICRSSPEESLSPLVSSIPIVEPYTFDKIQRPELDIRSRPGASYPIHEASTFIPDTQRYRYPLRPSSQDHSTYTPTGQAGQLHYYTPPIQPAFPLPPFRMATPTNRLPEQPVHRVRLPSSFFPEPVIQDTTMQATKPQARNRRQRRRRNKKSPCT
ncbi:E3 ubiquitin- ligase NRDP1 [Paramuricea clavata]|uniref:E3 ubiquitin- ligase NRDP1 n=1 Tax=Paramuricea clavata TaxID=317549 RepID=A0A6S7I842_PARCT|nr:E3 ubiquitin- ligase NRDP1 [Paramuricea clavata]